MAHKRLREYNMLIPINSKLDSREGMLLTDKELQNMEFHERRDLMSGMKLAKVKVYNTNVFYAFGARFASSIKTIIK